MARTPSPEPLDGLPLSPTGQWEREQAKLREEKEKRPKKPQAKSIAALCGLLSAVAFVAGSFSGSTLAKAEPEVRTVTKTDVVDHYYPVEPTGKRGLDVSEAIIELAPCAVWIRDSGTLPEPMSRREEVRMETSMSRNSTGGQRFYVAQKSEGDNHYAILVVVSCPQA